MEVEIVVTGIIKFGDEFLIVKRSENDEKHCVLGVESRGGEKQWSFLTRSWLVHKDVIGKEVDSLERSVPVPESKSKAETFSRKVFLEEAC